MTKKTNKILVFVLLLFSAFTPHAATLNATTIGGMWTTTPITTAATQALTGFRGAFTPMNVGMVVGHYVIISTIGDGVNTLRAQMGSNLPAAQLPPVQGWSDPNTPPSTSVPTSLYTGVGWAATCSNVPSIIGCTIDAYKSASGCTSSCPTSGAFLTETSTGYTLQLNPGSISSSGNKTSGCQSGYALVSGACNLSAPLSAQWPSDGIQSIKINPATNKFMYDPRDPDNAGMTGEYSPFGRTGKDPYNNPLKESLTPNAAGGVDYQRDTEGISPTTGEPMVQRDKFSTDATGQVISKSSTQYGNSTINNVNTSNVSTTGAQIDTSGLSQEATSQAILNRLDPGTAPQTETLDSSITEKNTEIQTDLSAIPKDLFHNPTSMLQLPHYWDYASGECYPAEFDAGRFGTISLQKFCQIYDEHIRSLIVFIFGVIACLHVFHYWRETIIQSMPS